MKWSVFLSTQAPFHLFYDIEYSNRVFRELFPNFIGCEHIRWREEQLEVQAMNYEEPNNWGKFSGKGERKRNALD